MKAKQMLLAILSAAAMVSDGAINPTGDTSGAGDSAAIQSAVDAAGAAVEWSSGAACSTLTRNST